MQDTNQTQMVSKCLKPGFGFLTGSAWWWGSSFQRRRRVGCGLAKRQGPAGPRLDLFHRQRLRVVLQMVRRRPNQTHHNSRNTGRRLRHSAMAPRARASITFLRVAACRSVHGTNHIHSVNRNTTRNGVGSRCAAPWSRGGVPPISLSKSDRASFCRRQECQRNQELVINECVSGRLDTAELCTVDSAATDETFC